MELAKEEKEAKKKVVETNLRSVTQSCKDGVPFDRLERDYRDLLGTPIPYQELGYKSLEQLIRSMPSALKIIDNGTGRKHVVGVADQSTAHIASLIARQKSPKRKPGPGKYNRFRLGGSRGGYARSFFNISRNRPTWQKPVQKSTYPKPEYFVKNPPAPSQKPCLLPDPLNKYERPLQTRNNYEAKAQPSSPLLGPSYFEVPPRSSSYETPPRFMKKSFNQQPARSSIRSPPNDINQISNFSPELQLQPSATNFIPDPYNSTYAIDNRIPSPKAKKTSRKKAAGSAPPPPLPDHLTSYESVVEYAKSKNIKCEFKTQQVGQKKKYFICTLHLGDRSFSSYPKEIYVKQETEEYAASLALQAITEEEQNARLPTAKLNTEDEIHIFLQRIETIVSEKPNGIWSTGVPKEYERKFNELLPNDWLNILKENSPHNVDISNVPDEHLRMPKGAYILKLRNSGSVTPTSTSSKTSSQLYEDFGNLNVHSNSLTFPEDNEWPVFVTYVSRTVDIAVRLIDYAKAFEETTDLMQEFYKKNLCPLSSPPQIGKLYAAHQIVNSGDFYYRVRVNYADATTKEVTCYFVDIGETSKLSFSQLQELHQPFETLPSQAIHISLDGLEDYIDLVKFNDLDEKLLDKTFIASIKKREGSQISAVLYDTSGETDVNLNMALKEITLTNSISLSVLPQVGSTAMAYLTHAYPDGEIYIKLNDLSTTLLNMEMEKLFAKFEEAPPVPCEALFVDKVYVAKYSDGAYYRTILLTQSFTVQDNEVEMFYVDFGNCNPVSLNDIKDLAPIAGFLASWPFQAIPCILTDVPPANFAWNESVVSKLYELAPDNKEIIVKVDKLGDENVSSEVTLFVRNQDQSIVSINQTLSFNDHLFSPLTENGSVPYQNVNKPASLALHGALPEMDDISELPDIASYNSNFSNMITSPSELFTPTPDTGIEFNSSLGHESFPPPPEIPSVGSIFDVYIPFVASPSNFVVQPYNASKKLTELLDDMQAFYYIEDNQCELPRVLLKIDHFYAALHYNIWYRVKIKDIEEGEPTMVTAYFIDFGDFAKISIANLQPLYKRFLDLPCQAIKATLYGIKPIYSDWLPEQCLEVKELLMEKQFVSHVADRKKTVENNCMEWTLVLSLVDTSSPTEDVYIHELLIKKNIAAEAT